MRIGLFGFPLTGKSTLFRLLTGVEASQQRAARGEGVVGVARVPDPRLDRLAELFGSPNRIQATIEYVDIAGMGKGEAVQVLPLDQLRTADALAHVVRAFEDEAIPHSEGAIDPARDVAAMETEFILADQIIAERRIEKLEPLVMKANRPEDKQELELLRRIVATLEEETPLRNIELSDHELQLISGYTFLSLKPLLVVVNASEAEADKLAGGAASFGLEKTAERPFTQVAALSAKIESEIAELGEEDAGIFMAELGIEEAALDRMIRASYRLLGRISFFTRNEKECRAWTIRRGSVARAAAGAVHTDMERGFIRAELVSYGDLIAAGGWNECRENGTLRLEGKDYVVQDGDVINFRFNV
jgi:GTP-binding protein YchF